MSSRLVVSITNARNNPDSATVGFVIANAALAAGKEAFIWLSLEGVFLAQQGYADGIHAEGFKPLSELITSFGDNGGHIVVCTPCFKNRHLDESKLVKNAALAGGARLVELLSQDASCISY